MLLAMKKRGFGKGRWNGYGGKPNPGENIIDTAVRETQEEICVTPTQFTQVATLDFHFPPAKAAQGFDQQAVIYLCTDWEGEPTETEEMAPKWFRMTDLPYKDMWPDDPLWLPRVLAGEKLRACFYFDDDDQVIKHEVVRI